MRLLLTILFIMSQAGCTALLVGGGQPGRYPTTEESGQANKDCDEQADTEECN